MIKIFIDNFLQIPIYLISFMIKRNNNIWIFGSWKGKSYSDNSKYLFEYIKNNHSEISAYWIVKDKDLYSKLIKKKISVYYCYSIKGIYLQMKAGVCFFTQSHRLDLLGSAVWRSNLLFQLWHGMPLKKILNDDMKHFKRENSVVKKIFVSIFPWIKDSWHITISPSVFTENILKSAFGEKTKIINVGFPRNENILKNSRSVNKIKNIIYMPTFRDANKYNTSNKQFENYLLNSGFNFSEIDEICKNNNLKFFIKLHPSNSFSIDKQREIKNLTNIIYIDGDFDFYENSEKYDLLITDYSSIFFDWLLSKKPLLHVAFDLEEYIENNRELYFNYEDIKLGSNFTNWKDVFEFISDNLFENIEYKIKYENLYNFFFSESAIKSSENICKEVKKILQEEK